MSFLATVTLSTLTTLVLLPLNTPKNAPVDTLVRAGRISRDTVKKALDRALPQILDDFANGELENKEAFHVRAKQGNQPALNVIGKLDMRKGPDKMVLITMMRKDDFRTDAFGGGRQKKYEVSI